MTSTRRDGLRQNSRQVSPARPRLGRGAAVLGLLSMLSGCGSGKSAGNPPAAQPSSPQSYLAPFVVGVSGLQIAGPQIYTIDDVDTAFTQTSYSLKPPFQEGAQILSAGTFKASTRGLLDLTLTASYAYDNNAARWLPTNPISPAGGLALELGGQTGGLVQLDGQPVLPLVPASVCPNLSSSKSFNYLTIPAPFPPSSPGADPPFWNPSAETAYGTVDISTNGSTVSLKNDQQFTFPFSGAAGSAVGNPSALQISAVCGSTAYGNTISIPGRIVVNNPGGSNSSPPQAIANIGPTGLLVENNGFVNNGSSSVMSDYENALGAGTGAIGLPVPSSGADPGTLVGAQYAGFVYGTGGAGSGAPVFSSYAASFGFSSVPPGCAGVAAPTSSLIYGGDMTSGNCDLALDLGTADASRAGLFPNAKVWMGSQYPGNRTSPARAYSFQAVAIAGQLGTKSAIFVLGVDPVSNQAWSIYLLQSN